MKKTESTSRIPAPMTVESKRNQYAKKKGRKVKSYKRKHWNRLSQG
jgi:hypothetical protein